MKTTLESDRPLEPGVALRISERDETNALVGFYRGFWNPDKHIVELYPMHNPYCWWRVPRVKHCVSEYIITVPGPVRTREAEKTKPKVTPLKVVKPIKSQTAKALKELSGQKKIDF